MNSANPQQLLVIAAQANARIDELFADANDRTIPAVTVGMVRIVLDIYQETVEGPAGDVYDETAARTVAQRPCMSTIALVDPLVSVQTLPPEAMTEKPKRTYSPERIAKATAARAAAKAARMALHQEGQEGQAAQPARPFPHQNGAAREAA